MGVKLQIVPLAEHPWKEGPEKVIVLYAKTKQLYCYYSQVRRDRRNPV